MKTVTSFLKKTHVNPLLLSTCLLFIASFIALLIVKKAIFLVLMFGLYFVITFYKPSFGTFIFFLYIPFYNFIRIVLESPIQISSFQLNIGGSIKDYFLIVILITILVRNFMSSAGLIKVNKSPSKKWFIIFIIFLSLNFVLLFSGLSSIIGFRSYFQWALIILLFSNTLRTNKNFYRVLKITQVTSVIFAIVAIYQYFINDSFLWDFFLNSAFVSPSLIDIDIGRASYRAISFFGHPNNLGLMLAIGSIISYNLIFIKNESRVLNFLFFVITFVGILTTHTRSSLLALFVGIILWLVQKETIKSNISKLFIGLLTLCFPIGLALSNPLFLKRFSTIDILSNPRLLQWGVVAIDIYRNPQILLYGRGIGYHLKSGIGTKVLDNSLIELLWEGGIILLIPFTIFVYKIIFSKKHSLENNDSDLEILIKSTLATICFQMLTNSFLTGLFSIYFWFLIGYFLRFECYNQQPKLKDTTTKKMTFKQL
jgi:hypothetical protein